MSKNILFFVTGSSASGKTCFSQRLSEEYRIPYVDYDDVVQPFLRGIENRCGENVNNRLDFYQTWREESYASFLNPVERNIKNGISVIAAAPLTKELKIPDYISLLKKKLDKDFLVVDIHLIPDENEHFRMLKSRKLDRDRDTIGKWESVKSKICYDNPLWDVDELIVIRFDSCSDVYDMAVNELKKRNIL